MPKLKGYIYPTLVVLLILTNPAFAEDKNPIVPDDCYQSLDGLLTPNQITLSVIAALPMDTLTDKQDGKHSDKQYSPDHTKWYVQVTDWHSHMHGPDSDVIYIGYENQADKILVISPKEMASSASIAWKDDKLLGLSVFLGTKMSAEMVLDTSQVKWISQKARRYYGKDCE